MVEHRGRLAGLIVDSASEVLKIPASEIEAAPAMMQASGLDCVTGLGKYKGRLIILLDIDKVLAARVPGAAEQAIPPMLKNAPSGQPSKASVDSVLKEQAKQALAGK